MKNLIITCVATAILNRISDEISTSVVESIKENEIPKARNFIGKALYMAGKRVSVKSDSEIAKDVLGAS